MSVVNGTLFSNIERNPIRRKPSALKGFQLFDEIWKQNCGYGFRAGVCMMLKSEEAY